MKEGEVMDYLRSLENVDFSGPVEDVIIMDDIEYNRIDFAKAKGNQLVIRSRFANILDISDGEFIKVELFGRFNIVDATRAKIKLLDIKNAEIIMLDDWQAKISETRKS